MTKSKSTTKTKKTTATKKPSTAKKTRSPRKKKTEEKKAIVNDDGFVEIVYLHRTSDAVSEMRSAIQSADPLKQLQNIDADYKDLLEEITASTIVKANHADNFKWTKVLSILDKRTSIAMKLLNKLAPDFDLEQLQSIEGKGDAVDIGATRDEAIAKLAKALKPKSKVANITDAK